LGEGDSDGDSQVCPAYVCRKEQKLRGRRNSGCVLIHIWCILGGIYMCLGLCHPRGRRCERGGVRGSFHVADKAGVGEL
jgi:hypothetical protein